MKIKTIKIKNFKSIGDAGYDDKGKQIHEEGYDEKSEQWGLVLHCNDGINVFIGKNGAGKSVVFEAIEFVLGEEDPTKKYLKNEWTDCNVKLIQFNKSIAKILFIFSDEKQIGCEIMKCLSLKFDNSKQVEMNPKEIIADLNVDETERIKYKIIQLTADRFKKFNSNDDFLSIFGKNNVINFDGYLMCRDRFLEKYIPNNFIIPSFSFKYYGEGSSIIARIIGKTNSIFKKECCPFYAESSGIKNSFIITSALGQNAQYKDGNPIFIDEPELYLHPHAKKTLHNKFQELENRGNQIFYITHSAEFLSYENSNQITRFYIDKESGNTRCKTGAMKNDFTDCQLYAFCDKISFNSAFFADKILLVEGKDDFYFINKILQLKNLDLSSYNMSIIDIEGKPAIMKFYEIYNNLGIDTRIVFDLDYNKNDKYDNDKIFTTEELAKQYKYLLQLKADKKEMNEAIINTDNVLFAFFTKIEKFLDPSTKKAKNVDVKKWFDSITEEKQIKIDQIFDILIKWLNSTSSPTS